MSPAELGRIIGWIGRFHKPKHPEPPALHEIAGAASWSLSERLLEPEDIQRLIGGLSRRAPAEQQRQEVA